MFSRRPGERFNRGRIATGGGASAPVNLASYFSAPYQSFQTNLGLTYGGSLLPATGNTATTTVSLSGSLGGVAVPIRVLATNSLAIGSGGTFNVSLDEGTTQAITGIVPSAGVAIPLTGAAAGLFITFAAGTSVNNNSWNATCAAVADQTSGGYHFSQATAGIQPIIGVGVNGIPSLKFGSAAGEKLDSLLNMPAPGTTPWAMAAVLRTNTYVGSGRMIGAVGAANTCMLWTPSSPNLATFNGLTAGVSPQLPAGTWGAVDCAFTNSIADYCRPGTGPGTAGSSAGNSSSTGRRIGFDGTNPTGLFELLALAHVPVQSFAAWRAGVTAMFGGTVAV